MGSHLDGSRCRSGRCPGPVALSPGRRKNVTDLRTDAAVSECRRNERQKPDGTLPAADCGLFLLRIGVAGLMLALHGWARFFRASDYLVFGTPWPFVDLVAGLGFPLPGAFGGDVRAVGILVRAVLMANGLAHQMGRVRPCHRYVCGPVQRRPKGDPIELPALYLVGALTLMITGPGRFALDRWQRAQHAQPFEGRANGHRLG